MGRVWAGVAAWSGVIFLAFLPVGGQTPPEVLLHPARAFTGEPFSRIRGVVELGPGEVLVADQIEQALYRVDFGHQVRTLLAGRGEGPEEYATPVGIYPFRGDSALLVDLGNGRLSVLAPEGVIKRTEPLFTARTTIPKGAAWLFSPFPVHRAPMRSPLGTSGPWVRRVGWPSSGTSRRIAWTGWTNTGTSTRDQW